jgi:hypothetical protein
VRVRGSGQGFWAGSAAALGAPLASASIPRVVEYAAAQVGQNASQRPS